MPEIHKQKSAKKKILIDLDVITVAIWDKKGTQVEIAKKFINKVEAREFYIISPFFLIELALKWKYKELSEDIKEFYVRYSDKFVSDIEFKEKSKELNVNAEGIIRLLEDYDIKQEDSVLVLVTSIFNLDYLITFNRKHLKNKKEIINMVLMENGLRAIKIIGPDEI